MRPPVRDPGRSKRREEIATRVLVALVNNDTCDTAYLKARAQSAVQQADALLAELAR